MENPGAPTVCRPAVVFPDHTITQDETLQFIAELFPHAQALPDALRMIRNTQVSNRHLIRPISDTALHPGLTLRNEIYTREARRLAALVARQAIVNAGVRIEDITMVIATSCTGFTMPSLTAMLINDLDMPSGVRQLPVAQLGCAAGGAAVNFSVDHCRADERNNVLIVSVELPSLCFQPSDDSLHSLISAALFGDAASAVVVRGRGGRGFAVDSTKSHFIQNTEHYIAYDVRSTGFHFLLDRDVMHSIEHVAPVMNEFVRHQYDTRAGDLDFYVLHTGGRRIMNELVRCLRIDEDVIRHSRSSLAEHGNIASAVVFDVLRRHFDDADSVDRTGQRGMLAAFGPGFTAEMCVGRWV